MLLDLQLMAGKSTFKIKRLCIIWDDKRPDLLVPSYILIYLFFYSCGYVLLPDSIRLFKKDELKQDPVNKSLKIRILAARNLRADQAKSISEVQVKTTIIRKQMPKENQTFSSR